MKRAAVEAIVRLSSLAPEEVPSFVTSEKHARNMAKPPQNGTKWSKNAAARLARGLEHAAEPFPVAILVPGGP